MRGGDVAGGLPARDDIQVLAVRDRGPTRTAVASGPPLWRRAGPLRTAAGEFACPCCRELAHYLRQIGTKPLSARRCCFVFDEGVQDRRSLMAYLWRVQPDGSRQPWLCPAAASDEDVVMTPPPFS